jgi:hypothetical protein
MFKLQKPDYFVWPVTVQVPQDGGTFIKRTFKVKFALKAQSEMDAAVDALRQDDIDILRDLVVGWPDGEVQDNSGQNIDFAEETRDKLIDIPYVRTGLLTAYFNAANGNKVKVGNS